MRATTISKGLLILGLLVGAATGIALALGLRLDQLPPWVITVGMYKLAFIAAGGLFVAGALLGRAAQNALRRRTPTKGDPRLVGESGPWIESDNIAREPDPVKRDRRDG
jgi:hypothetical protein